VSAHKGRRPKVHEEEHDTSERWAVSYADMMTVLVGLFIVLYAMGVVDQTKFDALRSSLAAGFGNASPAVLSGSSGVMKDAGAVPNTPPGPADMGLIAPAAEIKPPDTAKAAAEANRSAAEKEAGRLEDIKAKIEARLVAVGLADQVRYVIDERGLVIGLVSGDLFFDPASAALKPMAMTVLDAAGPVLAAIPDQVSVEGHANVIPVSGRYPTNWELSADRATQVLRHLVEVDGIAGTRIYAVGFGDSRPLGGDSADAMAVDRRVDLVVHSPLPEPVRALLPTFTPATKG